MWERNGMFCECASLGKCRDLPSWLVRMRIIDASCIISQSLSFVNVSTIKWSDRVPRPLLAAHRPKPSEVCHIATTEGIQTATGSAGVWVRHRGTRNES